MEEHVLTEGKLLDEKGNLLEAGYSTSLVKEYDSSKIKAGKMRIKEWDYYYFGDLEYGIALTIDDNRYRGLVSFSILDFKSKTFLNHAKRFPFPRGKVSLPSTSVNGSVKKEGKDYRLSFENENGKRYLHAEFKVKDKSFVCEASLHPTTDKSRVIATPFFKKKHFYYNQKINLLNGDGYFSFGDVYHEFKDIYGVLDWGRGVWTYKNTWYWSSLSGIQDGIRIGFNLGCGFGDTSKASENRLFVNDKVYKYTNVIFAIPRDENGKEEYLKPWQIYSVDKKINLEFYPVLDRHDKANALIISQDAHQVFGKFYGVFKTKDGDIQLNGRQGFAEKVRNRW
ncbi:MAG: DUF2804 domain-containing protein [Mollicutes bacterium]|nr:DUF2804 domain-containing protein [Mollicutes bacterium]